MGGLLPAPRPGVERPHPTLAIEVDNKADSSAALATYARLGVPEVWRYRVETRALRSGRLAGDRCESIDRSLSLPRLTPAPVIHAPDQVGSMGETAWKPWRREWARGLPGPPEVG